MRTNQIATFLQCDWSGKRFASKHRWKPSPCPTSNILIIAENLMVQRDFNVVYVDLISELFTTNWLTFIRAMPVKKFLSAEKIKKYAKIHAHQSNRDISSILSRDWSSERMLLSALLRHPALSLLVSLTFLPSLTFLHPSLFPLFTIVLLSSFFSRLHLPLPCLFVVPLHPSLARHSFHPLLTAFPYCFLSIYLRPTFSLLFCPRSSPFSCLIVLPP